MITENRVLDYIKIRKMTMGAVINATNPATKKVDEIQQITDVYISIFFDGTGNNMYEQYNKYEKLKEKLNSAKTFAKIGMSFSDGLFTPPSLILQHNAMANKMSDIIEFGMEDYNQQLHQAEQDYDIHDYKKEEARTGKDELNNNGGWKYSNIAVLRSLTKNKEISREGTKVSANYNLYIEGTGKLWEEGKDIISLGMGVGRSGVVGLVSKSIVFIENYLKSIVPEDRKDEVNIHFAIFGFSRGSTCGRLFSFMATRQGTTLPENQEKEFQQYLPASLFKDNRVCFLDRYDNRKKVTIDFLGIYDTVSSIGFLYKNAKDGNTNYGVSRYITTKQNNQTTEGKVNLLSKLFLWGDAKKNLHCDNVTNYHLYVSDNNQIKHTFHICAIDEFRENFALVDLGTDLKNGTEVFMPGCHSDIGGSYVYDDEIEKNTLRRVVDAKPTRMVSSKDPREAIASKDLSQDVLLELGWFTQKAKKTTRTKFYSDPNGLMTHSYDVVETKESFEIKEDIDNYTDGQTTFIEQTDEKIEFERFVKEGYSNITLDMMIKRINDDSYGLSNCGWPKNYFPASGEIPSRFRINDNDNDLKELIGNIPAKMDENQRYWVIPDEALYKKLRSSYLHFSCTDELNPEQWNWGAVGANLGNTPNWHLIDNNYYLLCRLIYRGNVNDKGFHYMSEYKK